MTELLLLSNSTSPGLGFLEHALDTIAELVPPGQRLLFVPFASGDPDGYTDVMTAALAPLSIQVSGAHREPAPGPGDRGGRRGLRRRRQLVPPAPGAAGDRPGAAIAARVRDGLPYLGASAGTNMACPTLRTTNDMPIVQPASFEALGLIPFQINPHYLDPDPASTHQGETRQRRIEEFLEENDVPVLGLREGSWLRVRGGAAAIGGTAGARLFARGAGPRELPPGSDVSDLLAGAAAVRRGAGERWLAGEGAGAPGAGAAVQRGAQQPGFRRPFGTEGGGRSRRAGRCGPGGQDGDHGRDLFLGRIAAHDAQAGRRGGIGVVSAAVARIFRFAGLVNYLSRK